jgi:hypothetical protein
MPASTDPGAREYYTQQLGLRKGAQDQRNALCPFHEDSSKSLSVNLSTGLWHCHAGCGAGNRAAFAAKLNGRARPANAAMPLVALPHATATYLYTTSRAEQVVFRKRRFESANGKKTFRCEAKNGDGWDRDLARLAGVTPPLYNLPCVLRPEVTTLVKTEGEKDADRLKAVLPATHAAFTNYEGGATNKWYPEYAELVAGKHIVVCEDNDEVGRAHAAFWAECCLTAGALSVKLDSYADTLPEKGDVSDYLVANPDADLLSRWAALPAWSSPEQQRFLTAPEFLARLPEKVEWIWQGRIPKGSAVLLTGQNKVGKSTFVNYMIRARSLGKEYLGQPTVKGRTLLLTEMSGADLRAEFAACPGLGESVDVSVLTQNDCYDWNWEEALRQAYLRCVITGVDMLVVDTFNSWTLLENQNDAAQTLKAYHPLRQFLQAGIAVFIEDHEGIDNGRDVGIARRGSTALTGQVSVVMSLRHVTGNHGPDTRLRQLVRSGRHGISAETIEWAGNEYKYLGTSAAVAAESAEQQVAVLLPREIEKAMSLTELVKATSRKRSTLQRAVKEMVARNLIQLVPSKHPNNPNAPVRYWVNPTPPRVKF